jgi:hypothetical protein
MPLHTKQSALFLLYGYNGENLLIEMCSFEEQQIQE